MGTKNLEVERKVERNKEVTAHKFWKLKKLFYLKITNSKGD